jgi:hypothetical protein
MWPGLHLGYSQPQGAPSVPLHLHSCPRFSFCKLAASCRKHPCPEWTAPCGRELAHGKLAPRTLQPWAVPDAALLAKLIASCALQVIARQQGARAARSVKFSAAPVDLLAFAEHEQTFYVVDARNYSARQTLQACPGNVGISGMAFNPEVRVCDLLHALLAGTNGFVP